MAEGARIQAREPVLGWEAGENGVSIRTSDATYTAGSLVLTAGPWLPSLLESVDAEMVAERRVIGRFGTADRSRFRSSAFPVSSITTDGGRYGAHPNHGLPGVKVSGGMSTVESTDPDDVAAPGQRDEAPLRRFAERYLAGGDGPTLRLETCMYTNTADGDPVIDRHPDRPGVYVAGGFSGHGYKFTPVIGEIMTEFILEGETTHDIDPFRIDRF
jgi:sarcosine oxidase